MKPDDADRVFQRPDRDTAEPKCKGPEIVEAVNAGRIRQSVDVASAGTPGNYHPEISQEEWNIVRVDTSGVADPGGPAEVSFQTIKPKGSIILTVPHIEPCRHAGQSCRDADTDGCIERRSVETGPREKEPIRSSSEEARTGKTFPRYAGESAKGVSLTQNSLTFLYEFASRIHAILDLQWIQDTCVHMLSEVLPVERITFVYKDEDANRFRIHSQYGLPEAQAQEFQRSIRAHLSLWLNGKPDTFVWSGGEAIPETRTENSGRLDRSVTIPIHSAATVVGVVHLLGLSSQSLMNGEYPLIMKQVTQNLSQALGNLRQFRNVLSMAETDSLTGLPNHRAAMKRFHEELDRSRRYRRPLSLVLLDVDRFKETNDLHGHLVGDEVLRRVSGILKENIRSSDLAARHGGDEFVILLPETGESSAVRLAQRIRSRVSRHPWGNTARNLKLSVSMGIASTDRLGPERASEMFFEADRALYLAKHRGRNRVCGGKEEV